MARKRTFTTLDGLRGVAALMVLLFHLLPAWSGLPFPPSAFLSVDLFFLLSGFVIGHAYDDKLAGGMSLSRFLGVRLIRLYPLYILGCAMGLAVAVTAALASGQWWTARPAVTAVPWALLMLPRPSADLSRWFTLNPPAWSLFSEMLVNILYAVFFPLLTRRVLIGVTAVSGAALAMFILLHGGMNGNAEGWLQPFGNARPIFPFAAGLLLYRMWRTGALPTIRIPAEMLILAFVACLAVPATGMAGAVLTVVVAEIGFPLLLIAAVNNEPSGRSARAMASLGQLSYPLYALHYPLIVAMWAMASQDDVPLGGVVVVGSSVLVAWLALVHYDKPVRAWLTHRFAASRNIVGRRQAKPVGVMAQPRRSGR